ncbi:metallophosphoesterase [Facklamia sp. P12955]|uniref:metallophosphoesterase n=1 Tax=unclassified Facklamia TaxID=2622293 RepID=UPI003D1675C0
MKIGVISDLHIDLQAEPYAQTIIDLLAKETDEWNLSYLIIAGDIANHQSLVFSFIKDLQAAITIPLYFVPGNHDYWSTNQETQIIYDSYCNHPNCLIGKPLSLNQDWGLVGHSAWYNHSGNFGRHDEKFLQAGRYQGYKWEDKLHINWQQSDRQVSREFARTIEKDMIYLNKANYILVTHFVTDFDLQILPDPKFQEDIDYFNAFISTDDLKPLYDKYPIRHSFMGHVHRRQKLTKQGCNYYLTSLGTPREWEEGSTLLDNLKEALKVIEIGE